MKKILIIEDDPGIRANVLDLLDAEGYEAEGAANGRIGVEKASQFSPDLIVCDIMLPELDGYEVLKTLRQSTKHARTPFLFFVVKGGQKGHQTWDELGRR